MKITIQVVVESADVPAVVTDVVTLEREALTDETFGLSLAEGKTILAGVQEAIVAQQAAAYLATQQTCPVCGTARRHKGHHHACQSGRHQSDATWKPSGRRCCPLA